MEPTEVKNRLAELRAERGWSQGDLAEKLAVSRQTVNALERGKYDPSLPLAFKPHFCSRDLSKRFVNPRTDHDHERNETARLGCSLAAGHEWCTPLGVLPSNVSKRPPRISRVTSPFTRVSPKLGL
ncbi:MAG: helix-turn-helix transcriptional regulator [Pirellulaceae bacterium]